jgi:hypothetical protein
MMAYPPQPVPYSFSLMCNFKPQSSSEVRIQTDLGPVSARMRCMRRLPAYHTAAEGASRTGDFGALQFGALQGTPVAGVVGKNPMQRRPVVP